MMGDSDDPGGMGTGRPRNDTHMRSHIPAHPQTPHNDNNPLRNRRSKTNHVGKK